MRYSVTGTSGLFHPAEHTIVDQAIAALEDVDEFSTGGAVAVDSLALHLGIKHHPNALHRLCLPTDAPFNEVVLEVEGTVVEWAENGATISSSYMNRNDLLVSHCDVLLAFPRTETEERRSGTWATVRRARAAGKVVQIHPLARSR